MRSRLAMVLSLLLVASALAFAAPAAHASDGGVVLAQENVTEQDESEGGETGGGDGEGQSDPDAETGAGEGEQATEPEETGPPWTYQMAWITLALLALLGLGLVVLYYRLIAQRRKGEA